MSDLIINGVGRSFLVTREPKSNPMTNKVFQHSLHRELWQWLADNPGKDKDDWPRWERNGGDVRTVQDLCFACEYDDYVAIATCQGCPLVQDRSMVDVCLGGLYAMFYSAKDTQERTRLALLIKDLPVKDGVVTE